MTIPKFYRKFKYKKLLKRIDKYPYWVDMFLCHELRTEFPFFGIKHYPELWERRKQCTGYKKFSRGSWFINNNDRTRYLEQAIKIIDDSLRKK